MLGVFVLRTLAFDHEVRVKRLVVRASSGCSTSEEVRHVLGPVTTAPVGQLEPLGSVVPEKRFDPRVMIQSSRDASLKDVVTRGLVEFRVFRLDASVDGSNPAISGHRKAGHFRRPETAREFYFMGSRTRKDLSLVKPGPPGP